MDCDPLFGEMRFHRNTSCEQVEAANLRLLTLASSWRGSQNRKAINELVNGGLQHISKIALRYAARDRAMVPTIACIQLLCPEPFAVCQITLHSLCLRLNSPLCTPLLSRSCSVVVCSCALRGLLCLSCRRFPAMPLSEQRTINPLF